MCVGACVLGGCASGGSSLKDIDVVYRFDNVRKTPELDEWAEIRSVLARHATRVSPTVEEQRVAGPVEVRAYKAVARVESVRTLELIQADLEQLAKKKFKGERVQFALANLQADYRSNLLTAGVEVSVGGIADRGAIVRVYPWEGARPIETRAGSDGAWRVPLKVVPETRWVYASSADAAGKLPTRYSRIDVSSQRQEQVDEADFVKMFPPGSGGVIKSAPVVKERRVDRDADSLAARIAREDEERRKARAGDDVVAQKRRELDERDRKYYEKQEKRERRASAGS